VSQPPKILRFGPASAVVKGDGWRIQVRVVGWWRPRLFIAVDHDPPGREIPQDSPYPVQEWT
jgi:hypothetical protein